MSNSLNNVISHLNGLSDQSNKTAVSERDAMNLVNLFDLLINIDKASNENAGHKNA